MSNEWEKQSGAGKRPWSRSGINKGSWAHSARRKPWGTASTNPPPDPEPTPDPPPSFEFGTVIDTIAPTFTTTTHPVSKPNILSELTGPLPTNAWWTNFYMGSNPIETSPYQLKPIIQGLYACTANYTATTAGITSQFLQNIGIEASETIATRKIQSYTDAGIMYRWEVDSTHKMIAPIVQGMAYITMNYTALTPKITTQHAILSVNGSTTPGSVNGTKFKIALNNGHTWIIYTSSSITFDWQNSSGWRLLASGVYTGTIQAAYLYDTAYETALDVHAGTYATQGIFDATISGDIVTMTFDFAPAGGGVLMHFAYPHQVDILSVPNTIPIQYKSIKGLMTAVLGSQWTLVDNLTTITWDAPRGIDSDKLSTTIASLQTDKTYTSSIPNDPYFGGKEYGKLGRLLQLSENSEINDVSAATTIRSNTKTAIQPWLDGTNSNKIKYDSTWGGICTTNGLASPSADFGAGYYNDHHFHWGYHIYAAASVARNDSAWALLYKDKVNCMVRDIMNPSSTDPYFTRFRHMDFFNGHSWAKGIFDSGDNRDQESTSEAINAWYGCMLWGIAIGDNNIKEHARILLAMEIRAAKKYWQITTTNNVYSALGYNYSKGLGIVWNRKVDDTTFFGGNIEFRRGIQIIPITPITEEYITMSWVTDMYPEIEAVTSTAGDGWNNFIYAAHATIDRATAWTEIATLGGYDGGNSKTNMQYWVATRPPTFPPPRPDFSDITGKTQWLKSDTGVTYDGSNLVSSWSDQSGVGFSALQSTSSYKPLYVSNTLNGYPVIRFDGVDDYMSITGLSTGGQVTAFVVAANKRSIQNANNYTGLVNKVDVILAANHSGNQAGKLGVNINSFNYYGDTKQRKFWSDQAGVSGKVVKYKNGDSTSVTTDYGEYAIYTYKGFNVQTNTVLNIGTFINGTFYGQNDIAEIIIYGRSLSTTEQQVVEAYLNTKYSIDSYKTIIGSDVLPNYQRITHQLPPESVWNDPTPPLPTNAWFSAAYINQYGNGTSNIVRQFPYSIKCKTTTLEMCIPTRTVTSLKISENYSNNMSFGASESIVSEKITRYDDLSFSEKWSVDDTHYMSSDIVRGSPYITMNYTALTPVIVTASTISSVNGAATTPVTDTKFKIVLANGQTWLLYSSASITLAWTGTTMTASATFTGSLRLANMPAAGDEAILDTYKSKIPTAGAVSWGVVGDTGTITFTWSTTGTGSLMMMALPHQVDTLQSPTTVTTTYNTLKGYMTGIIGTTWTMEEPLSTITWTAPRSPDAGKISAIQSALATDYTFTPSPNGTYSDGDVYFYGKEFAKMARIALIADELSDTTKRDFILNNLKLGINVWLNSQNSNYLRYDTRWGGIITQKGAQYPYDDFTAGWYSDHNFHWGYFVYAAAVIAKYDNTWYLAYKDKVNDLVRDYMCLDANDQYYPLYRNKDFFDGHSWASGLFEFDAGKNLESTSESINSYYAAKLWGTVTGNTALTNAARIMLAIEIRSAIKYWHMKSTDVIYDTTFNDRKCVGILWSAQADYTVFFETAPQGTHQEWIFGIQMLPFTPITEEYLDSAWVTEAYPVVSPSLTRAATAHAIISGNSIRAIAMDTGGTFADSKGYTRNPSVTITGGGGSGAAATATRNPLQGGSLSIAVTNGGSGYTNTCGNLLLNPSAETDTIWQRGGVTSAVTVADATIAYDGSKSIKVVETAGNCFCYQDISVTPGQIIQFSVYAQITALTSGGLQMVIKPSNYAFTYASSNTLTAATGAWTRLSGSWTVPQGVTSARIILDGYNSPTLTGYFDAAMVEVSNTLSAYCAFAPAGSDPTITIAPAIEEGWKGFLYMFNAVIDKATAWTDVNTLTSFDNGNSKTNTLYWVATRP